MWSLSGDDIERAREELKGRRAAIKAHYDNEMKKLDADVAAIETFERAAVNFVSNFKGAAAAESATEPVAAESASEPISATSTETPVEESAAAGPELAAGEKGSSRWRMRLGAAEGSR
jgi:hypothetical protein